jgi:hypothetical protein
MNVLRERRLRVARGADGFEFVAALSVGAEVPEKAGVAEVAGVAGEMRGAV